MAANHAPKPTCLNRLTTTPMRACSAGARKAAAARTQPSALRERSLFDRVSAIAPPTARSATRPTHWAADASIDEAATGVAENRPVVVNVIPCRYDGPA